MEDIGKLLSLSLNADFLSKLNKKLQAFPQYNQIAQQMGLPPLNLGPGGMGQTMGPIADLIGGMGQNLNPANVNSMLGQPGQRPGPMGPGMNTGRMGNAPVNPDIGGALSALRYAGGGMPGA